MKIKLFLLIALLSLILVFLTAPLRSYVNFQTSSLVGYILFFALTLFCINKYREKIPEYLILLALLLGLFILELPLRFSNFEQTLVSLPDFIIHFLGVVVGYIFMKTKRLIGITITFLVLTGVIYMFFSGYGLWLNKLNYGSYTGQVFETVPQFEISLDSNKIMTNETIKNKVVVLDFWNTACGVCFKKFPVLQMKFEKYNSIEGIKMYAVDIKIKRDTLNQAINTIRRLKYTFPVLVVDDDISKKFNIHCVPTTIIMYDNRIVYRGDIDEIDKVLDRIAP